MVFCLPVGHYIAVVHRPCHQKVVIPSASNSMPFRHSLSTGHQSCCLRHFFPHTPVAVTTYIKLLVWPPVCSPCAGALVLRPSSKTNPSSLIQRRRLVIDERQFMMVLTGCACNFPSFNHTGSRVRLIIEIHLKF